MNTFFRTLSGLPHDQYWANTVLLLHGDGTNTAQNNTFLDSSNTPKTITRYGNTTQGSFSPFTGQGGSIYFDGAGDYLSIPSSQNFNFGGGDFTIEGWINVLGNSTYNQIIVSKWVGIDNYGPGSFEISIRNNGKVLVGFSNSTVGGGIFLEGTSELRGVGWKHIALVKNGNLTKIFVNGIEEGSRTESFAITDLNVPVQIGKGFWSAENYRYFNGYIDDFRITKGKALYTANFTPPTAPLTADGQTVLLLKGENGGIIDSTRKNDLETVGNAQISTAQSKFGGSSMYFDGTGDYLSVPSSSNFAFGTGDHTLEAWIWWDGTYSNNGRVIYATGGSASLDQFGIFSGVGLHWAGFITGIYPPINQWSHVAVSRQGTTVRFFIGGVLVYTGASSASIGSSTATAYIGYRGADGNHPWLGYIDDLRITKGVARYTSNFTVPTQPYPNF